MELTVSGIYDIKDRQPVLLPDKKLVQQYGMEAALRVMRPSYRERFMRLMLTDHTLGMIRENYYG